MKFFFWRSSQAELIATQRELIDVQQRQIEELKALFNMKSNFEIVEQTEQGVTLKMKAVTATGGAVNPGRAGFRSRVAVGEAKTIPVPNDSVRALEQRVAKAKLHQDIERKVNAE